MSQVNDIIRRCQELGIQLIPYGDKLKVRATQPPPEDLLAALRELKGLVLAELKNRQQQEMGCWVLETWRKTSLPEWRRILQQSIDTQDQRREEYARWMLRDILEDPHYKENH